MQGEKPLIIQFKRCSADFLACIWKQVTVIVFFSCLSELYMHEAQQKPFNNVKNPFKEGGQAVFVLSINPYPKKAPLPF